MRVGISEIGDRPLRVAPEKEVTGFPAQVVTAETARDATLERAVASERAVRELARATLPRLASRVRACVESQPIQDTFNLSVPERIFRGSLSSRRELGERMRTVQESWETSSI